MKITNNQSTVSRFKSFNRFGLSAVLGAATLMGAIEASAHGYVSNPKSRAFLCTSAQGGGSSPACQAAAAAGNSSQYEPQSIGIGGANDNHQSLIPDGQLCSAGIGSMRGLNLARTDWIATPVSAGPRTFTWTNTAAHVSTYFRYYITKPGYNPSQPLRWSDLEQIHQSAPAGREAVANHVVNLPQRTGRHVVYSIWQRDRSDALEGFYQCIDVVYGGTNSSTPVASSSSVPRSSTPSSAPRTSASSASVSDNTCVGLPTWNATTQYNAPQQVQLNSRRYSANYWTQGNNPAQTSGQYNYWTDLGACSESGASRSSASSTVVASSRSSGSTSRPTSSVAAGNCSSPTYVNGTSYANGALVQASGNEYRCLVSGWCSQGGAYAPGTGWAASNAWSLVRSCQ